MTFETVFESAPFGIAVGDPAGRLHRTNPALRRMLGYTGNELRSMTFADVTHPDDAEESRRRFRDLAEGACDGFRLEKRYLRKDGATVWAVTAVSAVRDGSGGLRSAVAMVEDVTGRRRAEDECRHLALAVTTASEAIMTLDLEGRVTFANPAAERMLGYAPGELVGTEVSNLVGGSSPVNTREFFDATLAGGWSGEMVNRTKSGREFPVWLRTSPMRDGRGRPTGMVGVGTDITERKMAEEALRESEARFRTLVDQAADAFFLHDAEGRFVDVNRRACESLGYAREELLRMSVPDIELNFVPGRITEALQRMRPGVPATLEGLHRRRDGTTFPVEVRISLFETGGRHLFLASVRDVTERTRLSAMLHQSEKLAAIGQLAAGVAHELNNPLQAIVACSHLLRVQPNVEACPQTSQRARVIHEAAERCAKIVKGLLSFARGDMDQKTTVDVGALLRSTAEFLDHPFSLSNVRVEMRFAPGLPAVQGNPVALQQVFTSLLLNAKDAMPEGGTVVLATRKVNGSVEISVADGGTGMAPEVKARLFEPFFTTKPPGKGTGLGLSTAYGVVKEHGGTIEAESEAGKGSTFRVRLPVPGPGGLAPGGRGEAAREGIG